MTNLPQIYKKSSDVTATFDYVDIAEGTGITDFYVFRADTINSMSTSTALMSNLSPTLYVSGNAGGSAVDTSNYDLVFNLPKTIKGKAFLSFNLGANAQIAGSTSTYVVATLNHYNGTTTQLSTATSSTLTTTTFSTIPILLYFDVGKTHFKKGETLRLTLALWGTPNGTGKMGYGVDPTGQADITHSPNYPIMVSGTSTRMTLKIPFLLDI